MIFQCYELNDKSIQSIFPWYIFDAYLYIHLAGSSASVQIEVDPGHPRLLPECRFLGADHGRCPRLSFILLHCLLYNIYHMCFLKWQLLLLVNVSHTTKGKQVKMLFCDRSFKLCTRHFDLGQACQLR